MAYLTLTDSQGLECNIIGLHVDEAMRKVVLPGFGKTP